MTISMAIISKGYLRTYSFQCRDIVLPPTLVSLPLVVPYLLHFVVELIQVAASGEDTE